MSKQELQKFLCGIYDLDFGFIPVFHPSQKKKKKKERAGLETEQNCKCLLSNTDNAALKK